jgi:hypothetical protein
LTPQEVQSVSLVAVAANPFDLGISHWLANLSEFRKISRVGELQRATTSKMEVNGGTLALANETKKTIIADVITKQLPAAEQAYAALHREAQRITEIKNNQLRELDNVARDIQNARIKLRGRILRYFEDLQLQMRNVGMETFDALMHREVGGEGCLIEQRIQEIFNDEVQSISSDLHRVRLDVNTEIQHFESLVGSMSKQGLKVLSQPGLINNKTVLIARDGVVAAAKTVGLDLGKMLKFKPWGAHNLAKGLGTGLAAVGLVMEAWDSYKEMERRDLFAKAIEQMISDLKQQANEIIGLIDGPDFQTKFFPTLAELQVQLNEISAEMTRVESQHTRFKHWYDSGKAIDVAFREIRTPEIAG